MKLFMILGGLIGFGIGLTFSWLQEASGPALLWRAAVGAYLGGILMRWWAGQCLKNFIQAARERQEAAEKAEAASAASRSKA